MNNEIVVKAADQEQGDSAVNELFPDPQNKFFQLRMGFVRKLCGRRGQNKSKKDRTANEDNRRSDMSPA